MKTWLPTFEMELTDTTLLSLEEITRLFNAISKAEQVDLEDIRLQLIVVDDEPKLFINYGNYYQ